jgi:hypothetical protein
MFITAIKGGLGNQLFQYAFGYYLKETLKMEWQLDQLPLTFEGQTERPFLLDQIDHELIYSSAKYHHLCTTYKDGIVLKGIKSIQRKLKRIVYVGESEFNLKQIQSDKTAIYYLDGYWQNTLYANLAKQKINILLDRYTDQQNKWLDIVSKKNTVALHIRRGDYASNADTNKVHGVLSFQYYQKAIQALQAQFEDLKFIVFSDEVDWVKQHFDFGSAFQYYSGDVLNPITDLCLMKACQHQITANSSFSWWAAFLNTSANKQIIVPEKWTNTSDTKNLQLYEPSWKII